MTDTATLQVGSMIVRYRDGAWRYRYTDNRGRDRWRRLSAKEQAKVNAALEARD